MPKNQLYNKDCMEFLNELDDDSIDLFILDPPYNAKKNFPNDNLSTEDYFMFTRNWMKACRPKLKKNGSLYIFINEKNLWLFLTNLNKIFKFRRLLVWTFEGSGNGFHDNFDNRSEYILFYTRSNNYTFNMIKEPPSRSFIKRWGPYADNEGNVPYKALTPSMQKRYKKENYERNPKNIHRGLYQGNVIHVTRSRYKRHPTEKPEDLISLLIRISSNENDLVCDFFAGSGTTLACSKKLHRNYIGTEIEKQYYDIAIKRLDDIITYKSF